MRALEYKSEFSRRVSAVLSSNNDVVAVKPLLQEIYSGLDQETPLVQAVDVTLVESKCLFSYFYQIEPTSSFAIQIEHFDYKVFLWIEQEEWCLGDDLFDIDRIAEELSSAQMFGRIPENVKELHQLLKEEYWDFRPVKFPIFEGQEPKDMEEVLSYDRSYVLAGTMLDNLEVIERQDWERLCENEKHWFE